MPLCSCNNLSLMSLTCCVVIMQQLCLITPEEVYVTTRGNQELCEMVIVAGTN